MSIGSSTSSDPAPSEGLWVVDVVAPLPAGRVRMVAADAAARLNLPAEKLVSLLENRIGPVTKPLPRISADRVAEVLNGAGAEVEVRTARATDGPPSAARAAAAAKAAPPPGQGRRVDDPPADGRRAPPPAREARADVDASAPRPSPAGDGPPPSGEVPRIREPALDVGGDEEADDAASRPVAPPPPGARGSDRSNVAAYDGPERSGGAERPAADEAATDGTARPSAPPSAPSSSAAARKERDEAVAGDPWSAMDDAGTGRPEDEAMLGAWRGADRGGRGSRVGDADASGSAGPASGRPPAEDRAARREPPRPGQDAASVAPSSAPPARPPERTPDENASSWSDPSPSSFADEGAGEWPELDPGRVRRTGSAARASSTRESSAKEPVRVTPVDRARTEPGAREPGTTGIDVRVPPPSPAAYDPDAEDEDETLGFGMRDPFAEAERRERAMRRWILGGALVVAAALFLILQWAYSRPGPHGAAPPAYEVGLDHYRQGAFVSAARAWNERAEAGDAQAMYMLGYMAEIGQGRPWSNREAAGWYLQAAERGHAEAQLRLAALQLSGMGASYDADEALEWTLRAARAGHPRAQLEAARLLAAAGRHHEAAEWLEAASRSEPEAAGWLGVARAVQRLAPHSE